MAFIAEFCSIQRGSRRFIKSQTQKKRSGDRFLCCFKEFKGLEAMYGAADGTRTRDPRRDRPVF
jgi:hypothetical protein